MSDKKKEILHLTLKKKWFDMIAKGIKKEEYRDIKHYWIKRLMVIKAETFEETFKDFDIVRFKNGYQKDAPVMDVEIQEIEFDYGVKSWGAEIGVIYFVIRLGKILNIENYERIR